MNINLTNFIKNKYNINKTIDLNFDENKKYIFYNELKNNEGKRISQINQNNENINNYSSHSPSCINLYHVLGKLNITNTDKIVDIGSGKGFALSIMNMFQFKEILGIEISKKDYDICTNNLKLLDINNIKLKNMDIMDFENYGDYNMFYFYNPFSSSFFEDIIKKIVKKKSIIIYKNLHNDEEKILKKYMFIQLFEYEGLERNYYVFIKQ